jgi:hypothetical protein
MKGDYMAPEVEPHITREAEVRITLLEKRVDTLEADRQRDREEFIEWRTRINTLIEAWTQSLNDVKTGIRNVNIHIIIWGVGIVGTVITLFITHLLGGK